MTEVMQGALDSRPEEVPRWVKALLVMTSFLVVVLLVLTVALEIQVQSRNRDIRIVKKQSAVAVTATREASRTTQKAANTVNAAIAQSNAASARQGPAIAIALQTVATLEKQVQQLLNLQKGRP